MVVDPSLVKKPGGPISMSQLHTYLQCLRGFRSVSKEKNAKNQGGVRDLENERTLSCPAKEALGEYPVSLGKT